MKARAVLFDVDGTLLDTRRFIFGAFDHVLRQAGVPTPAHADYASMVGRPLEECYRHFAPGSGVGPLCDAHRTWQLDHLELVAPSPGARAALLALRAQSWRTAAVTNRSRLSSERSLERCGLLPLIDTLVAAEDVTSQKPDAEPVRLALARLEVVPGRAVMVGDTEADIVAGRAAGTLTVGVTFGFVGPAIAAFGPDACVGSFDDLLAWLEAGPLRR